MKLPDVVKAGDWIQALNLVEMAETERQRVFQALRVLQAFPPGISSRALEAIDHRMREWLCFEDDPELADCYLEMISRLAPVVRMT